MSPLYLTLLVIVLVFGVGGLAWFVRSQDKAEKSRKMSVITGRGQLRDNINDSDMKDKRRHDLARKLKEREEGGGTGKKQAKQITIKDRMIYAGIEAPISNFWIGSTISGVVFFILSMVLLDIKIVHILLAVFGFFGAPRLFLGFKTKKRQQKFLAEFADALESMVRLLKAGMPIGEAISMAAREYGGPVGEEMSRVYENQRIGVPLSEAVTVMSARVPLPEVQMFATGIVIQQQTGASLSEVLMNLSALIRARFRLKRKVQALSAEAKASAMIIGALPVVVATGLYFINPEYIGKLFTDPFGKVLLSCAIGWMCVGIFVMKQMINFKV